MDVDEVRALGDEAGEGEDEDEDLCELLQEHFATQQRRYEEEKAARWGGGGGGGGFRNTRPGLLQK